MVRDLSPAQQLVLQEMGVSGPEHARTVLALEIVVPVVFFGVALLIFWRRPNDWVATFVSAALVTYVAWISPLLDALSSAPSIMRTPVMMVQATGMVSAVTFFLVFPDGRPVPGPGRSLIALLAAWGFGWVLLPSSPLDFSNPFHLPLPSFVALMSCWAVGIAAQVYRFVRVATPVQRQQTKLVLFATIIGCLGYLVFGFDRFAVPVLGEPLFAGVVYDLIGIPLFLLTTLAIPVSFAVSILRYRLWDIDLVINRVIVYATLTAILGGMYSAMLTLSQRAFVALTGETSDMAIVLTVLVVGATFTHLKGRLQSTVDRYVKPAPDSRAGVRAFGEQLRSFIRMVDAVQLTRTACDEAVRSFGALGGAVYLRENGHFAQVHACGEWEQVEGMTAWLEGGGGRYGWIALGPRRNGQAYGEEDRRLFSEIVALAANTIDLVRRAGLGTRAPGDSPERPYPAVGLG